MFQTSTAGLLRQVSMASTRSMFEAAVMNTVYFGI